MLAKVLVSHLGTPATKAHDVGLMTIEDAEQWLGTSVGSGEEIARFEHYLVSPVHTDDDGRVWVKWAVNDRKELWKAMNSAQIAHGWGVQYRGESPCWFIETTSEYEIARKWFEATW
jgi:hypothetical protein